MIDTGEPKDGDFASYVEGLVHAPTSQKAAAHTTAHPPGITTEHAGTAAPASGIGGLAELSARLRAGATAGASTETLAAARKAAATVRQSAARLLERISAIASFAGIAILAISFTDAPPGFADPGIGIGLLIAAIVAHRLSGKLR